MTLRHTPQPAGSDCSQSVECRSGEDTSILDHRSIIAFFGPSMPARVALEQNGPKQRWISDIIRAEVYASGEEKNVETSVGCDEWIAHWTQPLRAACLILRRNMII
jgi:hypothetical protein